MARAVELATVLGHDKVDQALGLAATAGRFADGDLLSILGHLADSRPSARLTSYDPLPEVPRRPPGRGSACTQWTDEYAAGGFAYGSVATNFPSRAIPSRRSSAEAA